MCLLKENKLSLFLELLTSQYWVGGSLACPKKVLFYFLNTVFQNLLVVILLVTECYCRQFAEEIGTYWILHTTYRGNVLCGPTDGCHSIYIGGDWKTAGGALLVGGHLGSWVRGEWGRG